MKNRNRERSVGKQNRQNALRRSIFETLENRQMLAGDSGRQVLSSPDAVAPAVSEVFVSSPVFGSRFADHLVSAGLGTEGGFLRVPSNSPSTFPWAMNRIRVKFTEDVDVVMGDLSAHGVNSPTIQPVAFVYDPIKFEATWSLPVVAKDKLEFTLSNYIQSKLTGQFVDGVSNDTDPSNPFVFKLNVLLGDINRNGLVTSVDVNPIRDSLFSAIGSPNYSIYNDTNGDGRITSVDVNPVRDNLFSKLPTGTPASPIAQLKPGISRFDTLTVNEDSVLQTVFFAANTSAGPASGQSELQFSISSSNVQLVDDAASSVTRIGNHYALQFNPRADQFGQTELTIGVTDAAGTTSTSLSLQIQPINDAPYVQYHPGTIVLTQQTTDRTIDLAEVFDDVDIENLTYHVDSFNASMVSVSMNGSSLKITGIRGQVGVSQIVLRATDAAGQQVSTSVPVDLNYPVFAPLETIQYALASDQVIEYGGQNTFVIQTNFDESERITVSSSNEGIIRREDIEVRSLGGGKHRVIVRHNTEEYGLTLLNFTAEEMVFASLNGLILPSGQADHTEFGDLTVAHDEGGESSGVHRTNRAFNDRFIAHQVKHNRVSAETAFSIISPFTRTDRMVLASVEGASYEHHVEYTSPASRRSRIIVEVPSSVSIRQELLPPMGGNFQDAYDGYFAELHNSTFNPYTNPLNIANWFPASGLVSLFGISASASTMARWEFNPESFGNDPERAAMSLRLISSTSFIANLFTGLGAIKQLATRFAPGTLSNLALLAADKTGKSLSQGGNVFSLMQGSVTARGEIDAITEKVEQRVQALNAFRDSLVGFTEGASNDLQGLKEILENSGAGIADLELINNSVRLVEDVKLQVINASTTFSEEAGVVLLPPESLAGTGSSVPASVGEGIDENGDEQDKINEVVREEAKQLPTAKDIFGVGKRVYDIVKSTQAVIGQVGQLFESASSSEGIYKDNDGSEQNIHLPQIRNGTPGRDIVNSSFKADEVRTGDGDDRISSLSGNDMLYGGSGRNVYLAAEGNDEIHDGDDGSIINAGPGADTVWPGGGSDLLDLGTEHDKVVFEGTVIGNKVLVDPSRSGELWFNAFSIDQIQLRKDRYDLEIILPASSGRQENSIKFTSFFEHDAAGWEIIDRFGNRYNLYELTGRITAYEALQTAFAQRSTATPVYPLGIEHLQTFTDNSGRFKAHVARDNRLIGENSTITESNLFVVFEGNNSLEGWITRNQMASLDNANELIAKVRGDYTFANYNSISIVGVGEGGLIAQWFAAAAATSSTSFVSTQLVNAPDISGLLSQVVREEYPEYLAGIPKLSNYFLVNHQDWVSTIGIWAGNDEIYSTWKAYDFYHDPNAEPKAIAQFESIVTAHSPSPTSQDFDNVSISDLELSHVRGIVSSGSVDDLSSLLANIDVTLQGEEFDSTLSARIVLVNDALFDPDFDVIADTATSRTTFLSFLNGDTQAIPDQGGFLLRMDFQAAEQSREHLAAGFDEVTEDTLFNPDATAGNLQLFGWREVGENKIKAGEDLGRASNLERDSVKVKSGTFIIDVGGANAGPGTYNISITVGDREEIQESLQIAINGYAVDQVSTMPGDFLTRHYQVNTLESQLRIEFLDFGGQHDFTSINGVTVEKVNYRTPLPPSEVIENDPSLVVITQSYELPETSAGIEILKEALKAAAIAAATAGAGAVLGATSLGTTVATGLGGTLKAGALATATKGSIIAGFQAALPAAVSKGVLGSLITSIPQNLFSSPTARGILSGATSIFFAGQGLAAPSENVGRLKSTLDTLDKINNGLQAASGGLTIANSLMGAARRQIENNLTAPWVYDVAASLASMTQQFRLGKLDAAFVPVDLDAVEAAIANGKTGRQLLKHWKGSRDFLVLDWIPESDNLLEIDREQHMQLVNRSARVLKKLIEAYSEQLQGNQPGVDLDVLLVGHGAGHDINLELVTRLNTSEVAEHLDYVKVVALDAYTANEQRYTWYHPELTAIVDRVDNIYQQTKVDSSLWIAAAAAIVTGTPLLALPLLGADAGTSDLYHGGYQIGAMDGLDGGSSDGFYNRQARIFDLETNDEILRFRHWDPNEVRLSTAELTDIEFSPNGKLIAASGKDGIATVRYVDDVPDPENPNGPPLIFAGQPKFQVWGQESNVRSVSFFEVEVEAGVWKQLLLTVSDAKQEGNTDIAKNKVLVTDVETGLPVWQDRDINGTRAKASPSGNVIISGDRNGNAKIWLRDKEAITYTKHASIEAHTGQGGSYITDIVVINDQYFVTAGLQDQRVKMFRITENGATEVFNRKFDGNDQGSVRSLAYDPYNGILAIGAGKELSFWTFSQQTNGLMPLATNIAPDTPISRVDHVKAIQGIAVSKPTFLLDSEGNYSTDRTFKDADGKVHLVPRTALGDVHIEELSEKLTELKLPSARKGLKLISGGEDKTLFRYSLDRIDVGAILEESVLSGSMLPIRELAFSSDGTQVAVVGQDNIEENDGGPVRDIDVTRQLDERLEWRFANIFLQGREEHNAVPKHYVYHVVEGKGESFFWMRSSENANRPGDLDKSRDLALPPNKRGNIEGIDVAPIDLTVRPGGTVEIKPLQYLLEADRDDFDMVTRLASPIIVYESTAPNARAVGTIKNKRNEGNILPNVFIFEAYDVEAGLDFSNGIQQYVGVFNIEMIGPEDLEGNERKIIAPINVRIMNSAPRTYRDVIELHPNREEIDFRQTANDYDFDSDDFRVVNFPQQWQDLLVGTSVVAQYRKNAESVNGIDVRVVVDTDSLESLIAQEQSKGSLLDYLSFQIPYTVKEVRYQSQSVGSLELRLALQGAPENLRYAELGADRVRLVWDPVAWGAEQYIIQRYDSTEQQWIKHSPSTDVSGRLADNIYVNKIGAEEATWFRVVAKNANRTHPEENSASDPSETGIQVVWPPYSGPEWVLARSEGPARVHVSWEKVFWNLNSYAIELRRLRVGIDGKPILLDAETGEFEFISTEPLKTREVGEGRSATFKELSPNQFYQAVVTARNASNEQFHKTFSNLVSTTNRDFVSGIDAGRIGPRKMEISWSPQNYAQRYRIVAINPLDPFGKRIESQYYGKNVTQGIIFGLEQTPVFDNKLKQPEEWVVVVEAEDSNGNWISVVSNTNTNRDISTIVASTGQSQIELTEEGADNYWLGPQTSAGHVVRLPDINGLFVGTQFNLVNFARHPITLSSYSETQLISLSQLTVHSHTLHPAVGGAVERGIVVYKLVVENEGGDSYWKVVTSDNTTEARVFTTPEYLAAEPHPNALPGQTFSVHPDSRPRQLKVNWITPFWNPDTHYLELFEVMGDGTLHEASPPRFYRLENLSGDERTAQFDQLKPDTWYELQLTTRQLPDEFTHKERIKTSKQSSPDQIVFDSETLRSFEVEWKTVDWDANGYRIRLEERDGQGWRYIHENDPLLEFGPNAGQQMVRKTVAGLESGQEYRFTVEAFSNFENAWIPNDNKKIVNTLSFDLPTVNLVPTEVGSRSIAVDWSSVFNTLNTDGFYFGADKTKVVWVGPRGRDEQVIDGSATSYTIKRGLDRDTAYEVWVEFTSSDETTTRRLSTFDARVTTLAAQEPTVTIDASSITRHGFAVQWTHPNPQDVESFTVEISFDGTTWRKTAKKLSMDDFADRTNIPPGDKGPGDTFSYLIDYSRVEATHKWKYIKAGETHHVRVIANYDDEATPQKVGTTTPVTTLSFPAPTELQFSDVTSSSVRLSWSQESREDVEHFKLFRRIAGSNNWGQEVATVGPNIDSGVFSDVIRELSPEKEYEFRVETVFVAAFENDFERKDKESISVSASQPTLPSSVRLLDVSGVSKRKATVNWEEIAPTPQSLLIEVQEYDLNGQPVGDWFQPSGGNITDNPDRTSKEISELQPGTPYRVRLTAIFQDGSTVSQNIVAFSTEAYPRIINLDTSDRLLYSVTVSWTRLESLDNDANVTKNVVEVFKNNVLLPNSPQTGSGSGDRHDLQLTGLEKGTTYEFRVVAYNGTVKLSESDRLEFSTLIDGLTVDEETPFSARANWTQFAGGGATDYRVRALVPGTNTVVSEKTVSVGSGLRRTTIDGLSPNTNYEMIVEVLRNQTILSYSNRDAFTTLPAGLSGVVTTDVRRFSIDVAWNSVSTWANWTKVQWRKVGTSTWSGSGELAGDRTTYSITGLDKATAYEIKVSANGNGIYDEVIITRTTADFVKPSTPTFTAIGTREVTLNWNHSDPAGAATGFAIFRNGTKIDEVAASDRSYRNTGLTPNTTYTYFIRALYSQGSADSSTASTKTNSINYVAPVITGVAAVSSTRVNVSWSFTGDMSEVDHFSIRRNNSAQTQLGQDIPPNTPGQTTFTRQITRDANEQWPIFVRVRYKDGTIRNSLVMQLP